ncbi:glycosyltransferase family 2 protein [Candidatus Halocynthiibacter alkanivorans]|uniref:glycosyltransferase family 2 protein n=1 Tax=Candidatus Halocynthiibacter alkanivorans TaxID=2267619 RepID=UPI000DF318EC|nr:glycosyltransferase family 2 protein [Candidatus Halocynthiibacter alkanivorans]
MPRFSVILPCFNAADTILETLNSLREQSFENWELICIDDGSSDNTRALIRGLAVQDRRISLIRNPGKGPSEARNHGALIASSGELIAFCDADDLWHKDKLSSLNRCFDDCWVDGAYGRIAFFSEAPQAAQVVSTVPPGDLSIPVLLGENPVCTLSNLTLRRRVFEAASGFDPQISHNEDLEFLIRVIGRGARIVGINKTQVYYRASPGGLSADLPAMRRGRRAAMATAARFGFLPDARNEAVHLRYLARRALRLGTGGGAALRFTLEGLCQSPAGFLHPWRRGGATVIAAFCAPLMPRVLRRHLFST